MLPPTFVSTGCCIPHMFESAIVGAAAPSLEELRALLDQLKSGLAAAQARVTCTLAATRSRAEAARGVPAQRRCRGLVAEIALAPAGLPPWATGPWPDQGRHPGRTSHRPGLRRGVRRGCRSRARRAARSRRAAFRAEAYGFDDYEPL